MPRRVAAWDFTDILTLYGTPVAIYRGGRLNRRARFRTTSRFSPGSFLAFVVVGSTHAGVDVQPPCPARTERRRVPDEYVQRCAADREPGRPRSDRSRTPGGRLLAGRARNHRTARRTGLPGQ